MLKLRVRKRSGRAQRWRFVPKRKPGENPLFEVQFHPSDIRRGPWYWFVYRRDAWWAGALALGFFIFLVWSLWIAPGVIGDLFRRGRYQQLIAERAQHGGELETATLQLAELQRTTEQLQVRMNRFLLTYGIDPATASGPGQGYPFASEVVPESIYASAIRRGNRLQSQVSERLGVLNTFLGEIRSFEEAHGEQVLTTPSLSPLRRADFVLTSPYGTRRSPFTKKLDFHPGLDFAAPVGTPVLAPADGLVVFAGRYPLKQSVSWWRYGNLVALRHGQRFITLYGHCDRVTVKTGQRVRQGDTIATVGNTGWSTNPHLHYEVRRAGDEGEFKPVDPRIYILDHKWRDEEQLLVRARMAPEPTDFEPLPRLIGR